MQHLWLRLAGLLPIIALVVGLNVAVDPVHVLGTHRYEAGIARMLLAGQNVTNISNPHEAAYLRYYVAGLTDCKDVLVLGSSRSKLIRSSFFSGRTFFNNSISGAGLADYLAIHALYQQRGCIPTQLVMELSPWLVHGQYASIWEDFNKPKAELEARVLPLAQPARAVWDWRSPFPKAYGELLSPGYFQTSLFTGLRQLRMAKRVSISYFEYRVGDLPSGETLLTDGSTVYAEPAHSQAYAEKVMADALAYAQNPAGIPAAIDAHQLEVLEAFMRQLQQEGIEIIFYLPSYHPETYRRLVSSERYKIVVDIQRTLAQLAQRHHITIVGSYNPADVAMTDSDFFDGSHLTAAGIARLFTAPGGDKRPQLVGVSDTLITALPPEAQPREASMCQAALTEGWYRAEFTDTDWLRWAGRRGVLRIAANRDSLVILSGKVLAAQRPDTIDVLLNGALVKTLDVGWSQWEFRDFDPLTLFLRAGENVLEFVGHKPPLSLPSDSRVLALGLKNLHLVVGDGSTACELQP